MIHLEARCEEHLGDQWLPAKVDAEISNLFPFAAVRIEVETPEDLGIPEGFVRYALLIGPPGETGLPIELFLEVPFQGFSCLDSWSPFDFEPPEGWPDNSQLPGDLLQDALFDTDRGDMLVESLLSMVGAALELRRADGGPNG